MAVTSWTRVGSPISLTDYILKSLFDADTFLYATDDNTPVATSPANVMAALSGHAATAFAFNAQNLTGTGTITATNAVWYNSTHISASSANPGASGATVVDPSATTLGGYLLNADGNHLDFETHVESDWDGTDLTVDIHFEKSTAAGSVSDVAIIKLDLYYKGAGEATNKTQSLSDTVVVNDDAQYTLFKAIFTVDWDLENNVVEAHDVFGCHLWFDASNSDVANVTINHIDFKYKTKKPAPEV